jgi:hypothetical protein
MSTLRMVMASGGKSSRTSPTHSGRMTHAKKWRGAMPMTTLWPRVAISSSW